MLIGFAAWAYTLFIPSFMESSTAGLLLLQHGPWGIDALHRAIDGLKCTTAVHICYGYGIKANIDWKNSLGNEWRQYEEIFPALAASRGSICAMAISI